MDAPIPQRNADELQLLRIEEACRRLSLGRSKVYELIHDGRLPVVRVGRAIRIPVTALNRFVAELVESA